MKTEKAINALMAIVLSLVVLGGLTFQFIKHETPCALCLLQRLGMIGVATGALMNVKFCPRKSHYGLSLLFVFFGGFVALRHIALHACSKAAPTATLFWGLNLFTWSFIVFSSSLALIAILNLVFDHQPQISKTNLPLNGLGKVAFFLVLAVSVINIGTVFYQCGLGLC